MPTYTVTIPLKPISWNKIVAKNWRVYSNLANEWKEATGWAILQAKIPKITQPVSLIFTAHWKQKRRHDIDSLYTKGVVDSLVTCGVLLDDNLTQVTSVTFHGHIGAVRDELVLTIQET